MGDSSYVLASDGARWAFGDNSLGQLFDGTHRGRALPVRSTVDRTPIDGLAGICYLSLGMDGTLWACGENESGQLGDGTVIPRYTPVRVMGGVRSASISWDHLVIAKTDGSLWACGANSSGQLGDGTTKDRRSPVRVTLPAEGAGL